MELGVCAHPTRADYEFLDGEINLMKQGGFTMMSLDFSPRDFAKEGSYARWDRVIDALVRADIEPLPVICGWPQDRADAAFLKFVRTTAARYRGKIRQWSVWNEENIEMFWKNVSAAEYVTLLRQTRDAIKSEIPDATIVLGGLAGVPLAYIRELYRLGAKDLFDVMNVHPYCFPFEPEETLPKELRALKAVMRENGDAAKPIWVTEIGWPTQRLGVPDRAVWTNGLAVARPDLKFWRAVYASYAEDGTPPDEDFRRQLLKRLPSGSTLEICTATPLKARLAAGGVDLVILPFTCSYAEESFESILDFLRRGGTVVAAGGIPFGEKFRRLPSGVWGKVRNLGADWMPALRRLHLDYTAFWLDKSLGEDVRLLTDGNLRSGDRMVTLETYTDKKGRARPLALVVKYDSDLKGNLICDGYWGVGYDSIDPVSEEMQARYLVRAAEIAAAEGVARFHPYELRASEKTTKWSEDHFGIVHADLRPKPAYTALAAWNRRRTAGRTGFYRTRRDDDGRWWMVEPDGRDTLLFGVDHVRHMGWYCEATGRKAYEEANLKRFGTRAAWETNTLSRLKDWGFNLLGVGCDETLRHRGLAHTEILHLGDSFTRSANDPTRAICPNPNGIPSTAFPNVFHPAFADWCRRRAVEMCSPQKDDPDLVGYFTDNELCWWGVGEPSAGLFEATSRFPADHPARRALESFVAARGGKRDFETKRAFLRECARRYFETVATAVRATDPNHLVLGCRFANLDGGADRCVWEEAGRVCDVVSFNCYAWADLDRNAVFFNGRTGAPRIREMWDEAFAAAGKPLLVTEWSFPALDAGLPCSNGAGQRMRTQTERAAASDLFARSLLSTPYMLGYVYFMWPDQPKEGITRAFPENSNYGLVSENGEPYAELVRTLSVVQRDPSGAHAATYPHERRPAPEPAYAAAEARRDLIRSARGCVSFSRIDDGYRLDDGAGLVLAGHLGGDVFSSVSLGGTTVGRFTSMLCVRNGNIDWINADKVTAFDWKAEPDGRSGTLDVRVEGGRGNVRFETDLTVTVAGGTGRFLCELKAVRNFGTRPLELLSFFFREYPSFTPTPARVPPADWVWKGVPGARWTSDSGLSYGGESRSPSVRKFRYFTVDGVALPDAEFTLPGPATLRPGETLSAGKDIWMIGYAKAR